MVRRNALIRRLSRSRNLGSTSVICSDKTGTLTKDEMTVRRLYVAGRMIESRAEATNRVELLDERFRFGKSEPLSMLLQAAVLASDARVEQKTVPVRGKSKAIRLRRAGVVAAKAGLNKPALTRSSRAFPKSLSPPRRSE